MMSWPHLSFVAETDDKRIVGYVLGKLEDESHNDEKEKKPKKIEAHITSLSVLRTHRKLGLATRLMKATHR